jgi:hypothetical protein
LISSGSPCMKCNGYAPQVNLGSLVDPRCAPALGGFNMDQHIDDPGDGAHQLPLHHMADIVCLSHRHILVHLDVYLGKIPYAALPQAAFLDDNNPLDAGGKEVTASSSSFPTQPSMKSWRECFIMRMPLATMMAHAMSAAQSSAISYPFPPNRAMEIPMATAAEVMASER